MFRINGGLEHERRVVEHVHARIGRRSPRAGRRTNWKLQLQRALQRRAATRFEIDEETTVVSRRDSWSGEQPRGQEPRPEVVGRASAPMRLALELLEHRPLVQRSRPAIEYDFFPYSESSRRSLTLPYLGRADATTTTARSRSSTSCEETVPKHALDASLGLRQPWGSLSVFSELQRSTSTTPISTASVDVRQRRRPPVQGLLVQRLRASTTRSTIRSGYPKGAASPEEVLLRLRQLQTNYSYFLSFGVSYSFGSIFNTRRQSAVQRSPAESLI